MDNKTQFGFERTRFINWEGVLNRVVYALEESAWCVSATRAALDTWVHTYKNLKSNAEATPKIIAKIKARISPTTEHRAA
jgi:hypothetical protein